MLQYYSEIFSESFYKSSEYTLNLCIIPADNNTYNCLLLLFMAVSPHLFCTMNINTYIKKKPKCIFTNKHINPFLRGNVLTLKNYATWTFSDYEIFQSNWIVEFKVGIKNQSDTHCITQKGSNCISK